MLRLLLMCSLILGGCAHGVVYSDDVDSGGDASDSGWAVNYDAGDVGYVPKCARPGIYKCDPMYNDSRDWGDPLP